MIGDLTTLASVKQYAGVTSSVDDALLSALISAASTYVNQYLSRNLFAASYTYEVYDGSGTNRLSLRNYPITAVSSVKVNGTPVSAFAGYGTSSPTGYTFDDRQLYWLGGCFSPLLRNVQVSYTAGIIQVSGSPPVASGIPADIMQAVNEMVTLKYKRRLKLDIVGETLAQQTVTYARTDISPAVSAILGLWKNVNPV